MATAISKRQQARNERQLQELLRSVPGNDRCADCSAKNPGWASWNLGVFLCVRCASLHRKLGTHVSKVKSLSMDSWSAEQVENMKNIGNVKSNAIYNPRSTRADIPIDADEVESAMERYLRQKYETKSLASGNAVGQPAVRPQDTGSTGTGASWNEEPPALPPKPGKKFGFNLRSASSTFHRPKQDNRFTPPLSPAFTGSDREAAGEPPSPRKSKPSQVFGMKITGVGNNFDAKLATLRDMGFDDNRRNSEVLKNTNGNVDSAVETLVRLGEANSSASQRATPAPRTLTPLSMGSAGVSGISVEKTRQPEKLASNDPWEIRQEAPQRSATTPLPPRAQSAQPASNSWNPFLSQQQQPQAQPSLENSFQNLQVSQTGPSQQQQQYLQQQEPIPQIPQQYYQQQEPMPQVLQQYQNNPFQSHSPAPANPWQVQQQPQQSYTGNTMFSQAQSFEPQATAAVQSQQASNPFLRSTRSQTFTPSNPWAAQQSQPPAPLVQQQTTPWASQSRSSAPALQQANNPFGQPTTPLWQQQQQENVSAQPSTASPAPVSGQQEYFAQQNQAQTQQYQQLPIQHPLGQTQQNPWQQQPMPPQQTGFEYAQGQQIHPSQLAQPPPPPQPIRYDKSSILALYNTPQQAQYRPLQTLQEDLSAAPPTQSIQRSVTMPVPAGGNTFMPASTQQSLQGQGIRHVSNESADFVGMGRGRDSPDAFASLSARYMR